MKSLDTLFALLEAAERGDDPQALLGVTLAGEDMPKLTAWIAALPLPRRETLRARLSRLRDAIARRERELREEMLGLQQEIVACGKSAKAHAAYLITASMGNRKPCY
jgi:hypothetical protein